MGIATCKVVLFSVTIYVSSSQNATNPEVLPVGNMEYFEWFVWL